MAEENQPKDIEPKNNRILAYYFIVVLLLGLVVTGILVRMFDTAFRREGKMGKSSRKSETSQPAGIARKRKYLFCRRKIDGYQRTPLLHVY